MTSAAERRRGRVVNSVLTEAGNRETVGCGSDWTRYN